MISLETINVMIFMHLSIQFANGGKVESPNTVIDKSATKSPTEPENNSPHDKDPEKRKRHGDNPHKPINLFEKITGHQEQNKNQTCNINQNAEIGTPTLLTYIKMSNLDESFCVPQNWRLSERAYDYQIANS